MCPARFSFLIPVLMLLWAFGSAMGRMFLAARHLLKLPEGGEVISSLKDRRGTVMRSMIIIFAREFVARRMVLLAAVFAAILPLSLPLFSALASQGAVRDLPALIVSLGLGWVLSLLLGAGMFGSELSDYRMSFSFPRPISAASIWFGKLAATWAVVIGTEAIVILPSFVLFGSKPFSVIEEIVLLRPTIGFGISAGGLTVILTVMVPLLLVLAAHVIGTFRRVPSRWILFDGAAGASLTAFLLHWLVRPAGQSLNALIDFGTLMFFPLIISMFLSGWAQIAVGRTDTRKGRCILSIVLWSTLWFFGLIIVFLVILIAAAGQ
jgi:hypothetical protein